MKKPLVRKNRYKKMVTMKEVTIQISKQLKTHNSGSQHGRCKSEYFINGVLYQRSTLSTEYFINHKVNRS